MALWGFRAILRMQHITHAPPCPAWQNQIIVRKPGVFPEPDHHDPLAVLRYKIGGINDPGVQLSLIHI